MALLRMRMLRVMERQVAIPCFDGRIQTRTIVSARKETAPRTGFLEQMRRSLLPEVFGPLGGAAEGKEKRKTAELRQGSGQDAHSQDFKRTLVREPTAVLRERVISRYAMETAPRAAPEPPRLVVVDGFKGVGKSSVLEQTAAFARLKGFIVLYLPDPQAWTHGNGFFAATPVGDRDPVLEGLDAVRFYDRPMQLHKVFKSLLEVHGDDLADIPCREEFATELTASCVSLLDLVQMGDGYLEDIDSNWRQSPALAAEVFRRFVKELCACESKPVAIIIDNFEKFAGLTCMVNERQERLHANCIRTVADHFGRDAIERTSADLANGFLLLATDSQYPFEDWRKSRVRSGVDYPLGDEILEDPSGRQWISDFKHRVRSKSSERHLFVEVPELSSSELKTVCSTFVTGGLRRIVDSNNPGPEQDRLVALAGGRADLMRKIALSR